MKKRKRKEKKILLLQRKEKRRRKKELFTARKKLRKLLLKQRLQKKEIKAEPQFYELLNLRKTRKKELYKKVNYNEPSQNVVVDGQFGIEEPNLISKYLELSESFIDSRASELLFKLENCSRMWPTAIVLLCSLVQWVELTSGKRYKKLQSKRQPSSFKNKRERRIASTTPNRQDVDGYLSHCGFYRYVGRYAGTALMSSEEIGETVKIEREHNSKNIELREEEIIKILRAHSNMSNEDIEWFDSVVLTEILANVTDHGINNRDRGWWILGQYHKKHKIFSLCIADNGIGIRNSLMTGPQHDEIAKDYKDDPMSEGHLIKLALEGKVSGSLKDVRKFRKKFPFSKSYPGASRGHGLKRVVETCKKLKIAFSILSHNGFIFLDKDGNITSFGARDSRIFAGTMYHLVVDCKGE